MGATRRFPRLLLPILLACPIAPARAQTDAGLADRLRSFTSALDYSGGVAEARANTRGLRDPRARAWYALLLSRNELARAALAVADSMMAADRRSPWSWFARAAALGYGYDDSSAAALAASEELYRRAPRDPDAVWLRAATIMNEARARDAIPVADSFLIHSPNSARHLVLRANATWSVATVTRPPNQAMKDTALALWARARSLDSTDALAWVAPGSRLASDGRLDEGLALLRRGVDLAPLSPAVNQYYWRALRTARARDLDGARDEALPGIERLLAARAGDPAVLHLIANEYEAFRMTDAQRALQDRILRDHPTSLAAEWVLVNRYREVRQAVYDTTNRDSTVRGAYRRLLQDFVARPSHVNERLLGDAYRELYHLADSTTPPDTLLSWILGMERYEGINPQVTFAQGAIALADRGVHLDQAERLAREGQRAGRQRIDRQREIYEGVGEYAQALDWMTSFMVDALGWVHFRAGRVEDGERDIRRAIDLSPRNRSAFYHLGRMFEARNQPDSAEAYYIRGAMVALPGVNPNRSALGTLYETRRGSAEGWETYYAGIRDLDRARRRATIQAELRAARDPVPAFDLVTAEGARVRSDTLAGRVTVINFWGKWCGPCVAEMPEMQRFWRQVAGDSAVRFLTINNDQDLRELREWMERRRYNLPVLVDSGYARRANVDLYPTTWFLDRAGRIAFVKAGWSEELAEEFGWRVEILRAERGVP